MKYQNAILTFLPALLVPTVSAACWSNSGPQADQRHGLASLYAISVGMSGQFRNTQVKYGCIDDYGASTHYHLTVKNIKGEAQLTADYIYQNLKKHMGGCRRGGHEIDGDYEFNVDTLPGVCVDGNWLDAHSETIPRIH